MCYEGTGNCGVPAGMLDHWLGSLFIPRHLLLIHFLTQGPTLVNVYLWSFYAVQYCWTNILSLISDCLDVVGNGYCNDETNRLECNYDGGDCCLGSGLDTQYCTECQCLYGEGEGIFYIA